MMANVTFWEARPNEGDVVSELTIRVQDDRGEYDIGIRLRQPLAGNERPEELIRQELDHLREALDHIVATPEAISRFRPDPI